MINDHLAQIGLGQLRVQHLDQITYLVEPEIARAVLIITPSSRHHHAIITSATHTHTHHT